MENLVQVDRQTPFLMPQDLRDWLPKNHIVHFIIEAVEAVSPKVSFHLNKRGSGSKQFNPEMMMELLIYSYCTKRFSSYAIEKATYTDIPTMYITAMEHPDHNTINNFRKNNREAFKKVFTQLLLLAQTTGLMKKIGTISVDGTKIHANASKHKAVSYKYAKEQIEKYEKEVDEILKEAEKIDNTENDVNLPEEIAVREKRISILKNAVKQMEETQKEIYEHEKEEYERKMKEREEKSDDDNSPTDGKTKIRGKKTKEPENKVDDKAQVNFTDSESRIMKFGNSNNFEQSYNLQAAVDTDSKMIVGTYPTQKCNDKAELKNCVESVPEELEKEENVFVCADTGYFSSSLIEKTEKEHPDVKVICATEREPHGKTVKQIFEKLPERLPEEKSGETMSKEKMRTRLKTQEGQKIYSKRKTTVEPVFGIIKRVMGFRQFLMRGLENIGIEWDLVTISYNVSRMYALKNLSPAKM